MEVPEMRSRLLVMYPSGYIRNRRIIDMPDSQVYAIYRNHRERNISTRKPRMQKSTQVPGQINMFGQM